MADSSINVTEGSGKRLQTYDHTVAAVLVQRQAVVLGEQALASYVIASSAISTATADSHLLQIMAGSSNKLRIRRIEVYQSSLATTVSILNLALVRVTTAGTGGTSQTISTFDPSDAAAGATAQSLPSSKGTEGASVGAAQAWLGQTLTAGNYWNLRSALWDFDQPRTKPLIIAAGTTNGIVIKNYNGVAGANVVVQVWFDETAW